MARRTLLVFGSLLIGLGLVWTLQGVGVLGGSPMTGVRLWAVIGPVVVLAGLVMLTTARRRPRA